MSERRVICISFRESETNLYNRLKSFSCPSGTIKDILKEHFEYTDSICVTEKISKNNNSLSDNTLSIIDF